MENARNMLRQMPDWEVLARCIWGEAEGQPIAEKMRVASVIMNRLSKPARFGSSLKEVCLRKWQFECFWSPRVNKCVAEPLTNEVMIDCVGIATLYLNDSAPDVVDGADHYYALSMPVPPDWAGDPRYIERMKSQWHDYRKEVLA